MAERPAAHMKSAALLMLVTAACATEPVVRRADSCIQIGRQRHSHWNRIGGQSVSDAELLATLRRERRSRDDAAAARRLEIASLFTAAAILPATFATGFATSENRRLPAAAKITIDLGTFVAHAALAIAIGNAGTKRFNHAVNEYNAMAADLGRCPVSPEPSD